MAKAVLKFRCFRCGKLLGISATRAGSTTSCPGCKTDLIVPDPAEGADSAPELPASLVAIPGLDLGSAVVSTPATAGAHAPGFSWEDVDPALFQTEGADSLLRQINLAPPEPEPPPKPTPPPPPAQAEAPAPWLAPTTGSPPGLVVPEIAVEVAPVRTSAVARRKVGDVMLSQSVIASWSLFVLVALAVSFLAGVFVGHYAWKGH